MKHSLAKLVRLSTLAVCILAPALLTSAYAATSNSGGGKNHQNQIVADGGNGQTNARKPSRSQSRQACFNSANAWIARVTAICEAEHPQPEEFENCMLGPGMQYNSEIRRCQRM